VLAHFGLFVSERVMGGSERREQPCVAEGAGLWEKKLAEVLRGFHVLEEGGD